MPDLKYEEPMTRLVEWAKKDGGFFDFTFFSGPQGWEVALFPEHPTSKMRDKWIKGRAGTLKTATERAFKALEKVEGNA